MLTRLTLTLLASLVWDAASAQDAAVSPASELPPEARESLSKSAFANQYALASHLTPFYLRGDFNGDGTTDTAVLLKQRSTGKVGIGIVHGGSTSPIVLGAGRSFGNGSDDFAWMDVWRVRPKSAVAPGADDVRAPDLKGDSLLVEKAMSASALVYCQAPNISGTSKATEKTRRACEARVG